MFITTKMLLVSYVRQLVTDVISAKMLTMLHVHYHQILLVSYVRQIVTDVISAKMLTMLRVHYHQDAACVLCQAIGHLYPKCQVADYATCSLPPRCCLCHMSGN
jgi:hypothetical protein